VAAKRKWLREIGALAAEFELDLVHTKGGHIKLLNKRGGLAAVVSSSPSDWREIKNLRSDIKKSIHRDARP